MQLQEELSEKNSLPEPANRTVRGAEIGLSLGLFTNEALVTKT